MELNYLKHLTVGVDRQSWFHHRPVQNDNGELLDQQPMVAGKANKYMWHFWGSKDELKGDFSILAVKEGSRREIGIFSTFGLGGPLNGADANIPTSMVLPDEGMWRLNAYIGDRLFGSIYVKVDKRRIDFP